MSTLPATGSTISMSTVRNYFGLSGQVSLSQLGNHVTQTLTSASWWLADPQQPVVQEIV